jgi:pSer/pThr/pTyr-binding forkhead associated (FHA) protein
MNARMEMTTEILLRPPQPPNQEITTLGDDAKAKELPEGTIVILRVIEGAQVGKGYPLHKMPATLGRDALCDVSIVDSRMSRQHAMIVYYAPNFYLKDLGSTNGTFLDDKRIKQEVLKSGMKFKVGATVLEFTVSDAGSQAGA